MDASKARNLILPKDSRDDPAAIAGFAAAVLRALSEMAARSFRRQADLVAALHGARLATDPPLVKAALQVLLAEGCVTDPVPLSDGHLLLTVRRETLAAPPPQQWLPIGEKLPARADPWHAPGGQPTAPGEPAGFASAVLGIYRSSINGRQLRANPTLVRLNGYRSEADMLQAVGDIATEWYVQRDRRAQFQRLLHERGRVEDFVSEICRHRTRERIWISETGRLVRHPGSGEPLYYEGSVRELAGSRPRARAEPMPAA